MPVLPLIDLLLLSGWTALFVGFVLKAIHLSTSYRPTLVGLAPIDFLLIAVAALLFAIALAAREWVKTQAPAATAARRQQETLEAWQALRANGGATAEAGEGRSGVSATTTSGPSESGPSDRDATPEEVIAASTRGAS